MVWRGFICCKTSCTDATSSTNRTPATRRADILDCGKLVVDRTLQAKPASKLDSSKGMLKKCTTPSWTLLSSPTLITTLARGGSHSRASTGTRGSARTNARPCSPCPCCCTCKLSRRHVGARWSRRKRGRHPHRHRCRHRQPQGWSSQQLRAETFRGGNESGPASRLQSAWTPPRLPRALVEEAMAASAEQMQYGRQDRWVWQAAHAPFESGRCQKQRWHLVHAAPSLQPPFLFTYWQASRHVSGWPTEPADTVKPCETAFHGCKGGGFAFASFGWDLCKPSGETSIASRVWDLSKPGGGTNTALTFARVLSCVVSSNFCTLAVKASVEAEPQNPPKPS
mmetsp:Transcript_122480/g.391636  ORF Transcript_122480/g.391636 Transcript_122480/m.391636 type:complete len:339 (+) Transcript_122480:551-1567(+)